MSSPIRTHSLCEVVAGKRIGSSVAIGKIGGGFDGGNFGPLLIHFLQYVVKQIQFQNHNLLQCFPLRLKNR